MLEPGVLICPTDGTRVGTGLEPGSLFADKYILMHRIGAGGMGVIFTAQQQGLNRTVAIKMLTMAAATPVSIRRFQQEAQTLAGP